MPSTKAEFTSRPLNAAMSDRLPKPQVQIGALGSQVDAAEAYALVEDPRLSELRVGVGRIVLLCLRGPHDTYIIMISPQILF